MELLIRPFQPGDQDACKALVLTGLEEHWGVLDPSLNPDLNDIRASYADGCFLTAWRGGELVGTGGFAPAAPGCVQIARMSVRKDLRGRGVGSRILEALLEQARGRGAVRAILETTETWDDVICFYLRAGFHITHRQDGDVYFEKKIVEEN